MSFVKKRGETYLGNIVDVPNWHFIKLAESNEYFLHICMYSIHIYVELDVLRAMRNCINRCAIYYLNVLWMQLDDWSQNNNWTFHSLSLFHFQFSCLLSFCSFYPSVCFPLFYFSEFILFAYSVSKLSNVNSKRKNRRTNKQTKK